MRVALFGTMGDRGKHESGLVLFCFASIENSR